MRILHTSDWHLGQQFYGKSRLAEQQQFVDWLFTTAQAEQIDAIIVAGDIFDTATPPSAAKSLYHDVLAKAQQQCPCYFIAGNHDGVASLDELAPLLPLLDSQLQSRKPKLEDSVLTLTGQDQEPVLLCFLPYIKPRELMTSGEQSGALQQQNRLQQALIDCYQQSYAFAQQRQQQLFDECGFAPAIIATGHFTLLGGQLSESTRDIYIGSLDALPAALLPPFDYLAMGHLHRPQQIKNTAFYYSGSPYPLSFDELGQTKMVNVIDVQNGKVTVSQIAVPSFQSLQSLKGSTAQVTEQLQQLITHYPTDGNTSIWLEVILTDPLLAQDCQQKLFELCQQSNVEILRVQREVPSWQPIAEQWQQLQEMAPEDVFRARLAQQPTLAESDLSQLQNLFKQTVAQLQLGQDHEDL